MMEISQEEPDDGYGQYGLAIRNVLMVWENEMQRTTNRICSLARYKQFVLQDLRAEQMSSGIALAKMFQICLNDIDDSSAYDEPTVMISSDVKQFESQELDDFGRRVLLALLIANDTSKFLMQSKNGTQVQHGVRSWRYALPSLIPTDNRQLWFQPNVQTSATRVDDLSMQDFEVVASWAICANFVCYDYIMRELASQHQHQLYHLCGSRFGSVVMQLHETASRFNMEMSGALLVPTGGVWKEQFISEYDAAWTTARGILQYGTSLNENIRMQDYEQIRQDIKNLRNQRTSITGIGVQETEEIKTLERRMNQFDEWKTQADKQWNDKSSKLGELQDRLSKDMQNVQLTLSTMDTNIRTQVLGAATLKLGQEITVHNEELLSSAEISYTDLKTTFEQFQEQMPVEIVQNLNYSIVELVRAINNRLHFATDDDIRIASQHKGSFDLLVEAMKVIHGDIAAVSTVLLNEEQNPWTSETFVSVRHQYERALAVKNSLLHTISTLNSLNSFVVKHQMARLGLNAPVDSADLKSKIQALEERSKDCENQLRALKLLVDGLKNSGIEVHLPPDFEQRIRNYENAINNAVEVQAGLVEDMDKISKKVDETYIGFMGVSARLAETERKMSDVDREAVELRNKLMKVEGTVTTIAETHRQINERIAQLEQRGSVDHPGGEAGLSAAQIKLITEMETYMQHSKAQIKDLLAAQEGHGKDIAELKKEFSGDKEKILKSLNEVDKADIKQIVTEEVRARFEGVEKSKTVEDLERAVVDLGKSMIELKKRVESAEEGEEQADPVKIASEMDQINKRVDKLIVDVGVLSDKQQYYQQLTKRQDQMLEENKRLERWFHSLDTIVADILRGKYFDLDFNAIPKGPAFTRLASQMAQGTGPRFIA